MADGENYEVPWHDRTHLSIRLVHDNNRENAVRVDRNTIVQDNLVRYFYTRRSYGSTSASLYKDIILSYSVKTVVIPMPSQG